MVGAEGVLADPERPQVQRQGLVVACERAVELGEIVQALRHVRMLRAEARLAHGKGVAIVWLGRRIPSLDVQHVGEIVDAGGLARITVATLQAQLQRLAEQLLRLGVAPLLGGAQAALADLVPLIAPGRGGPRPQAEEDQDQTGPKTAGSHRHVPSRTLCLPGNNHETGGDPTGIPVNGP